MNRWAFSLIAVLVLCLYQPAGAIQNPIECASFECGLVSPWYAYEFTPTLPQSGQPGFPYAGAPGSTFYLVPSYSTADGSYACGMESPVGQSSNGGVYQQFYWDKGRAIISLKARVATSGGFPGNGCYVRMGVAPSYLTETESISQWAMCTYSDGWQEISLEVPAGSAYHTLFIEAYQPADTGQAMSTLWDDVRWQPYLEITDTPMKTGTDPDHKNTTAIIHWTTNLPSDSTVNYSSGGTWYVAYDATLTTDHSVLIDNLTPSSICTFNVKSEEPGCISVTSGNYSFDNPINVTNMSASDGNPDPVITWTTDVPTASWVEYGLDTGYGQVAGDATLTTDHTVTLTGLDTGYTYHCRAKCEAPGYITGYSADKTFRVFAGIQTSLVNGSFENPRGGGSVPSLYPWEKFTWNPSDSWVSGNIGPYPAGGVDKWYPVNTDIYTYDGFQAFDASYFLGSGSNYTYKNGGVYQRISLSTPQECAFSARFFTFQSIEGGAFDTQVDIGIDPTGGTNHKASSVVWWRGVSPTNSNKWYPGGVVVDAPAGVVTVFLCTRQIYGLIVRAVGIDDAVFGAPQVMSIGQLRSNRHCPGAKLENKIVTFVDPGRVVLKDINDITHEYVKVYVEEEDRTAGMAVLIDPTYGNPSQLPQVGNKLSVTGALSPVGEENVLLAYKWQLDTGTYTLPAPVLVNMNQIGGEAANQYRLSESNACKGICNLGLRMRLFGKVTWPQSLNTSGLVSISDSGKLCTYPTGSLGFKVDGVMVNLKDKGVQFGPGDYLAVTGVLTIKNTGTTRWPMYVYVLETTSPDDWSLLHSAQ